MLIPNKLPSMDRAASTQRGAVLVVALIFLLLLTILAISSSGRSLLQERMAGGLHNAQQADMSAQTALRGAEWRLWTSTSNVSSHLNCGTGIFTDCYIFDPFSPITNVTNFRAKQGWVTTGATEHKGYSNAVDYTATANGKLANNPRYLIEDLGVEMPPGVSGSLHESGATGATGGGASSTSRHIYRITARGTGGSENTVRVLESTFVAKSN
ncbi:MAG: pilus assembly protein [Rhodanobacter sp.]